MLAAVGQICSTANVTHNANLCTSLIRRAAAQGVKLLYLPEAADFIADPEEVPRLSEPLESGEFVTKLREQAKKSGIWVGVTVHEKAKEDANKCYNTNVLIGDNGDIVQTYRKLHLLDVAQSGANGGIMQESKTTIAGKELPDPVSTPVGKVGMLTCYDLRFPEAALSLRRRGADIIAYPSAFTMKTGPPHWEALLRARAIENQAYVLAPAQIGEHSPSRQTYGHAMIIDPWGQICAQAADRPPKFPPDEKDVDAGLFVTADIDLDWVQEIRQEMPLWEQRRGEVYNIA